MQATFVHLRLHSEYSMVDGTLRMKPLVQATADSGMPAVAVTDQNNMFGLVKFHKAATAAGVKPIFGADVLLVDEEDSQQVHRLVLLCRTNEGYKNLTRLVSRAYTEGQVRGIPMLRKSWLQGQSAGLIALSAGREGDVGKALLAGNEALAAELLQFWMALFPDAFYLELQRTGRENEETYIHSAIKLALVYEVPVVATNDVRFLKQENFDAHEARVCIHDGRTLDDPRRPKLYSEQQYLRSPGEMMELFADIPEALENTIEIARRCNVTLTLGENFLPDFPVPAGMSMEEYFNQLSRDGLEKRLDFLFDRNVPDFAQRRKAYDERLQIELDVINQMGFPGYFLIVADFILWAKNNGVPVGPGRGSGAGSLVAYALLITDLDPLEYDLLFERFLNPERVSMPDFDVDFCMEGRDRVIEYVAQHYGRDKVSQIITYGTMAAKAVVRDVGRVMGHGYGFVDSISKQIPFEVGITLTRAMEQEEELRKRYEEDDDVREIIDMALSLEGLTRNAGKHAGGVVIAPTALTDFTPIYCEENGSGLVSQFDKDDVEAVGLVKFDFLGLRTLTIIDWTIANIKKQTGDVIDIATIPLDDRPSFELLKACQTTAVFQLESRGMKDLIKRLQPDTFEDIIALVALFRPGPLESGMVDDFINRKHGRAAVEFPFEELEAVLSPTYGVIVYQEQVMQISQIIGNYSLGSADLLRRAMGKKKAEEMAKQREIFMDGARELGFDQNKAGALFDLMEKFAGYGFNKSHSAAYALVSYQTMWLKSHYPAAFMAAVLSADMDNTDKVVTLIDECRDMELAVVPPAINLCQYRFTVKDDNTVLYGLGAIKGVGEGAIENMVDERQANGPYKDLFDFCNRVDLKKVNRRVLEALIRGGAMDEIGPNRATLMGNLSKALKMAEQANRNSATGQEDMFGMMAPVEASTAESGAYDIEAEWDEGSRLLQEKETLGLYLTGHPIDRYLDELGNFTTSRLNALNPVRNQTVVVAGLVFAMRTMNTKRGGKLAFVTLDDRSARFEIAIFSEEYEHYRDQLAKDKLVVVEGEVTVNEDGGFRMRTQKVYDLEQARNHFAKALVIRLDEQQAANGFVPELGGILEPFLEGSCPIVVEYVRHDARARLRFGDDWRVSPNETLLNRLRHLSGEERVRLHYG